jgi:SAM-dependent methyltransferase
LIDLNANMGLSDGAPRFTGEFFVPGETNARIEADHLARYRFASSYARGKNVLDIACGVGYAGPMMLEAGASTYLGVDINDELVAYATHKYGSGKAGFAHGDVCTFRHETPFDLITCFETIEHVSDYREALQCLYELLSPKGQLLVSSPNRPVTSPLAATLKDKPANEYHAQEFTPDELIQELRAARFLVNARGVFGQRRHILFPSKRLNQFSRWLFGNPAEHASPKVRRLRGMTPRYFVVIASK